MKQASFWIIFFLTVTYSLLNPLSYVIASYQTRKIDININLVFIGYDQDILDINRIIHLDGTYDIYSNYSDLLPEYDILIHKKIISSNNDYYLDFLDYINTIANFSGVTSALNITLLEEDNIDPTDGIKSDIFYDRSGVSINATLVQNYLNDNPPIEIPDDGWTYGIYFLNLSILDIGMTEHWFDISEIDMDTGQKSKSWFSDYNGLTDRPVAGWGGDGDVRILFFDPSALDVIWYFDWMNTDYYWQSFSVYNNYVLEDLEDYIAHYETFHSTDSSLEEYLNNFIYDLFKNDIMICPYLSIAPTDENYYFEIAIVENFTRGSSLYEREDLEFVVNKDNIREAITDLLPFFNIQVNVHWYSLENYPFIQKLFKLASKQFEDYNQIEITEGSPQSVFDYLSQNLDEFVDIHPDGINFPTLVFLLNGSVMSYDGTRFGGLGGMGWQLIGYQWERLMDTSVTPAVPKNGITDVIIHEAGHTLGFSHPHHNEYWCGDFIDSIMSYYTVNSYFSKFEKDWLQSLLAQQLLFETIDKYETLRGIYSFTSPEAVINKNQEVVTKIEKSWASIKAMNFSDSFIQAKEAVSAVKSFTELLKQVGIKTRTVTSAITSSKKSTTTRIPGFGLFSVFSLAAFILIRKRSILKYKYS
ncbi:MAG: hypothetical protein ACFFB5_13425 [Promethearchaeota archaeon]